MKSPLAVQALENAVARRGAPRSPAAPCTPTEAANFEPRAFQRALTRHGIIGPMGQAGSAADNAAMESFVSLLQKTSSIAAAGPREKSCAFAIVTWIEHTYHRRRRQARLGRLTTIQFEIIMTTPAIQAA